MKIFPYKVYLFGSYLVAIPYRNITMRKYEQYPRRKKLASIPRRDLETKPFGERERYRTYVSIPHRDITTGKEEREAMEIFAFQSLIGT